jgi:hypothetical protein
MEQLIADTAASRAANGKKRATVHEFGLNPQFKQFE